MHEVTGPIPVGRHRQPLRAVRCRFQAIVPCDEFIRGCRPLSAPGSGSYFSWNLPHYCAILDIGTLIESCRPRGVSGGDEIKRLTKRFPFDRAVPRSGSRTRVRSPGDSYDRFPRRGTPPCPQRGFLGWFTHPGSGSDWTNRAQGEQDFFCYGNVSIVRPRSRLHS